MFTFRCLLFSIFFFLKGFFSHRWIRVFQAGVAYILARCGFVLVPAHDRSGFAVLTHTILHLPKSKPWPELSYKDEFLIDFGMSLSLGAQYWERKNSSATERGYRVTCLQYTLYKTVLLHISFAAHGELKESQVTLQLLKKKGFSV